LILWNCSRHCLRLFDAIVEANHRAVAGDANAGVRVVDFESELPVIALTCVDPRLNAFFPNVLGLPGEQFIWLRNAGNIITGPLSSTMRSLALACAVKGGREIAIIGHTDCHIARTSTMELLDRLKAIGVDRRHLPDNVNEYFGVFASEQQNVIKACDIVRRSPLIGPNMSVHGLMVDTGTGKLEWLVNGYQSWAPAAAAEADALQAGGKLPDSLKSLQPFSMGEMKFPDGKIGESVAKGSDLLSKVQTQIEGSPAIAPAAPVSRPSAPPLPPRIPLPAPIRPKWTSRGGK
jgi:carbonic anhydrase